MYIIDFRVPPINKHVLILLKNTREEIPESPSTIGQGATKHDTATRRKSTRLSFFIIPFLGPGKVGPVAVIKCQYSKL